MGNEFIKIIKYLGNCVLDVIYSKDDKCIICNKYVNEDNLLCSTCNNKVKKCKDSFLIDKESLSVKCYSATYYSYIIKQLVLNLKYKSDFNAGKVLSNYMIDSIKANKISFDVITYVPLTKESKKSRGYNQGKCLATFIGNKTNKKVYGFIKKCKNTKDQIGLGKKERWKNIKNSFSSTNKRYFKDKNVLIVDDVITTGATSFYCAKALLDSGAKNVVVLSAAKSSI